jgi:ketosteroid isomerase-like protein
VTVDLAWQWEDAVAARDHDALAALLTDDVVVVTPKGKVLEGRDAVRAYYAGPGFDHLEVSHEDHDFHAHADGVRMTARQVYRWKDSGEHAYDRPLEVVFIVRDDRIARAEMRILDAEVAAS